MNLKAFHLNYKESIVKTKHSLNSVNILMSNVIQKHRSWNVDQFIHDTNPNMHTTV